MLSFRLFEFPPGQDFVSSKQTKRFWLYTKKTKRTFGGVVLLLAGLFGLDGCSQQAYVRFKQKPSELNSSDALTQIMLVNKAPKIVLRVPSAQTKGVTDEQNKQQSVHTSSPLFVKRQRGTATEKDALIVAAYDETALYNAIEKQLFKEGFSVRDRALFNQVLPHESYNKISALTDTDLILELISIERPVGYNTNVCYVVKGEEDRPVVMQQDYRTLGGASVEFKLVNIKTNEVVGNYKIHYTPCTDDSCRGFYRRSTGFRQGLGWFRPGEVAQQERKLRKAGGFEAIDQDILELFMADATHQLVQSMR